MSKWRVILTDSESESGIAPICEQPDEHKLNHCSPKQPWVFDCCRGPHLECGTETWAKALVALFNLAEVQECS